jgi:uncharacterized membrane protein
VALGPNLGFLTVLTVLWVLGWSMVALAVLSWVPRPLLLVAALAVIAGQQLVAAGGGPLPTLLWRPGPIRLPAGTVFVAYPVLPWLAAMALGFIAGPVFAAPLPRRRRVLLGAGLAATALFVILRMTNAYGDPRPWTVQPRGALFTALSFLNCEKYPPSLLFVAMTLGPGLLALGALQGRRWAPRPLLVLGRVPLFFFLGHLLFLRGVSGAAALLRWGEAAFQGPPGPAGNPALPLWVGYLGWLAALAALYPLCRWFAALKERRAWPWLSYF